MCTLEPSASSSWKRDAVEAYDGVTPSDPAHASSSWVRARAALAEAEPDRELTGATAGLQRVCRAATSCLSLVGSVVHVMSGSGEGVVVAGSDEATRGIGEIAFAVGESPCLTAYQLARPVLVPDLLGEGQKRWPGYVSAIRNEGVGASYSFPLHVGATRLGVLDLYGAQVRTLTSELMSMAFVFAEVATEYVLEPAPGAPGGLFNERTVGAMERRLEIYQAQGMVTVDLGVDLAGALSLMRAHAFSRDVPLFEIAQAILAGERLALPGQA
jgi:hypothetical protein